jgi:hypothetical protein
MKTLSVLVLLCAVTPLVSCQESPENSTPPRPDSGNFTQNTYRNDFFGFSYPLPREWHKSSGSPSPLPSGAYYLFIGDRDTGHSLLNRITVVADPEPDSRPHSAQEYLSAFVRAEVTQAHAEVTRQPSSFASGGSGFYRTDYKWSDNGTTIYSSMVCIKRKNYWLSWSFVTPSQRDLDDAVDTVRHISFDNPSPRQQ